MPLHWIDQATEAYLRVTADSIPAGRLFTWGITLVGKGEYDRAAGLPEERLALALEVGSEDFPARHLNARGWLHIECGNLDRALAQNRQAAERAHQRGDDEAVGRSTSEADPTDARPRHCADRGSVARSFIPSSRPPRSRG